MAGGGDEQLWVGAILGGLGGSIMTLVGSTIAQARAYRRQRRDEAADKAAAQDQAWRDRVECLLQEHSEMLHSEVNRARSRSQTRQIEKGTP